MVLPYAFNYSTTFTILWACTPWYTHTRLLCPLLLRSYLDLFLTCITSDIIRHKWVHRDTHMSSLAPSSFDQPIGFINKKKGKQKDEKSHQTEPQTDSTGLNDSVFTEEDWVSISSQYMCIFICVCQGSDSLLHEVPDIFLYFHLNHKTSSPNLHCFELNLARSMCGTD